MNRVIRLILAGTERGMGESSERTKFDWPDLQSQLNFL